jgi:Uma2 family endonuclease
VEPAGGVSRAMTTPAAVRYLFSLEQYRQMGCTGVFHPDDRVELIEGQVVDKPRIGSGHSATVNRLNRLLSGQVGEYAIVAVQNPMSIPGKGGVDSEPQPDLMLLAPRDDFYAEAHPTPEDVRLLIEVADTTRAFDRDVKLPVYARAGVAEVWLVDLQENLVEVHRDPVQGAFRRTRRAFPGEDLEPAGVPGVRVAVREIFGRP